MQPELPGCAGGPGFCLANNCLKKGLDWLAAEEYEKALVRAATAKLEELRMGRLAEKKRRPVSRGSAR